MSNFFSKCKICYILGQSTGFVQRVFWVLALKMVEVSDRICFNKGVVGTMCAVMPTSWGDPGIT